MQEDLGQYYGEHKESETATEYLWMEEEKSLGLKMDLIRKYDLAGTAGWKLGLESPEIWDVIQWDSKRRKNRKRRAKESSCAIFAERKACLIKKYRNGAKRSQKISLLFRNIRQRTESLFMQITIMK